MKKTLITLLLISLVFTVGCGGRGLSGTRPKNFENAKAMVADAKTRITEISVQDFKTKIEGQEGFVLIDVREPSEFKAGNIPGSFNIPRGLLEFKIADKEHWDKIGGSVPEKSVEIILYCKKGGRGALSTEALNRLNYKGVRNLAGGWMAWEKGPEEDEGKKEEEQQDGGCG